MIIIRTECPTCGEIAIPISEMHLHDNTGSESQYYSFHCPHCEGVRGDEADPKFAGFLVAQGIIPEGERFAPEILEVHDGPEFTYDDILDLHFLLDGAEWVQDLASCTEAA